jgi:hypothetical protein
MAVCSMLNTTRKNVVAFIFTRGEGVFLGVGIVQKL